MFRIIILHDEEDMLINHSSGGPFFTTEELLIIQDRLKRSLQFAKLNDVVALNNKIQETEHSKILIERQKPPKQQGFVYLMQDTSLGYVKIGYSIKPTCRERTLQAQKPTIQLVYSVQASPMLEKNLHEYFSHKRIRGEWFDVTPERVIKIINKMA